MELVVKKSILKGNVPIPGSKSHTIRAIVIASLAEGESFIRNPLISSDTLSAVNCYRALGAEIDASDPKVWKVTGTGGRIDVPDQIIDVGNSGTTLRLAIASAALSCGRASIQLTGDSQIQSRPVGPLLDSITDLGAKATALRGDQKPPVVVSGKLTGGKTSIKCTTSQYLSSLLLAVPLAEHDTVIDVTLLNEPDYVQITLDWLDRQSIRYEHDRMQSFNIPGRQKYKAFDMTIPADFSSATFFFCAGVILNCDITLTGLDFSDSQPDKAVADYLRRMGANIEVNTKGVHINSAKLNGIEIDMNRTPDALPAMAVAAAFAQGTTRLVNVPQARNKETDRIKCMAEELKKASVNVEELPDGLIIHPSRPKAGYFDGRDDHRIVMALSLLGMAVDGTTTIDTAEAVDVTFPEYVDLMKSIGAKIESVD
jgi:3-phosphoshikimate 1-carboxyvinyltransferase